MAEPLADVEAIEAALLAALDGQEPTPIERTDLAFRAEQAGDAVSRRDAAAGERARALALALRDGAPLHDRLASLADAVKDVRDALRAAVTGDGAEERRRATVAVVVVAPEPAQAAALADAASRRGAGTSVTSPDGLDARLDADRPDVVVLLGDTAHGPQAETLTATATRRGVATVVAVAPEGAAVPLAAARVPVGLTGEELAAAALALRDEDPAEGARLLVVTRDGELVARIEHAVAPFGATTEQRDLDAEHGELALALPDLLVVDARRDPDGVLAWCRGLRLVPAGAALPVALIAGAGLAPAAGLGAGADDVLDEALDDAALATCLRNRLVRARALRRVGDADALTDLPRHVVALRRLGRLVERAAAGDDPLSLALVGIDGLVALNASGGRAAGDASIEAAARLLSGLIRDGDVLARWSGGEFLVAGRYLAVPTAVERMERALAEARRLQPAGTPLGTTLRLSIGIAGFPEAGTAAPALVEAAADALARARQAGGDRLVVAAGEPAGSGPDVILVEDSELAAAVVLRALEGLGLRVERFRDGALAADRLADPSQPAPRVVLLDWELPGLDGPGVLQRMRDAGTLGRTRAIMLTSRSGEAEVLSAMRAGASDHVAKPFSIPVLVERVRRALAA